jgi:programmed cell death protein 5
MNDIEELKKKKLQEQEEQIKLQQQIEVLENTVKQYLTKEAISRLGNLKTAHPEFALQVELIIAQLIQNNQLKEKITDQQLKQILLNIQQPKKEFKIKRK